MDATAGTGGGGPRSLGPVVRALRKHFETLDDGLVAAILFGSYATGHAHRESDVDVAVLLTRAAYASIPNTLWYRAQLGSDLIGVLHKNEVDVVLLNEAGPELAAAIVGDGVEVLVRDRAALKAFAAVMRSRYGDIKPWLDKWRRERLRKVAEG